MNNTDICITKKINSDNQKITAILFKGVINNEYNHSNLPEFV